jgi:hypothetical protein
MRNDLHRASLYFRFIREEHEHHHEIFLKGQRELLESLSRVRVDPTAPVKNQQQQNQNSNQAPAAAEPELPDLSTDLKKIYRKIVTDTHPDKLVNAKISEKEHSKKNEAYISATVAFNKKDEDALIEIAVDLELEIDLPDEQIAKSLRSRGGKLEDQIAKIKSSPEWYWAHSDENRRLQIIKEICQRNGWILVTDEQIIESIRYVAGMHPGSKDDVRERARKAMQERHRIT